MPGRAPDLPQASLMRPSRVDCVRVVLFLAEADAWKCVDDVREELDMYSDCALCTLFETLPVCCNVKSLQ